jgi:NAD(P)-dependent dehydrogenase (short-subunit alcohol dehydrogenase family)
MPTRRRPVSPPARTQRAAAVALVTGGARRIGRAIALELARDGWDVAVHYDRSRADALATVRDIEALGRRAIAVRQDLAVDKGLAALVAQVARGLGPVTCLVNNASAFELDGVDDFRGTRFDRLMRINCAAPIRLALALRAQLPAAASGVVINLLDQKLWNPNPDFLSYTLSKAALKEATTLLAQALAPRVRVVGVAPGLSAPSYLQTPARFARTHRLSPLGRSSTPEEIASACAFLARARAVTGTTLLVDGGQHLIPLARDFSLLAGGPRGPRAVPARAPGATRRSRAGTATP